MSNLLCVSSDGFSPGSSGPGNFLGIGLNIFRRSQACSGLRINFLRRAKKIVAFMLYKVDSRGPSRIRIEVILRAWA